MRVRDVMTTDVRVAIAEEPVVDAVRVMVETGFGAVPVVSREAGFRGIIRSADLAALIARGIDLDTTPAGDVVWATRP